jgi:hypothetical protein
LAKSSIARRLLLSICLLIWQYRYFVTSLKKEILGSDTFTNFFSNLTEVCDKPNFQCQDIYYFGETAVTTFQQPTRIVAKIGVKQVIAVTSRKQRLSGHHGSGCNREWQFYSAILRIPTKELQGLFHCKRTR